MKNPLRELLNRLVRTGSGGQIDYVDRGSGQGLSTADISDIVEVARNGVVVRAGASTRYVPYHRIVEVRDGEGRVLMRRRLKT